AATPLTRPHPPTYHRPLLLNGAKGRIARDALLAWFDSVSSARAMPWRKAWVNPADFTDATQLRDALERRAYEVWISEIMLQQTRVAAVIGYWNSWMARWPTIQDLARAEPDEVLSAWRGLGYYSRATRIHEAAKLVVGDAKMKGLLPSGAAELEAKVPGVGRYTGGAISSIVFGHPAPMVDGNVLRVLSRQLGILGDTKADKKVIDNLWQAADGLANAVARDGTSDDEAAGDAPPPSDRPGRWGQALMELGATICTPKPNCSACPVTSTCRAYAEGQALATGAGLTSTADLAPEMGDIEDLCILCEPGPDADGDDDSSVGRAKKPTNGTKSKATKNSKISAFFGKKDSPKELDPDALKIIVNHAMKFPLKKAKKQVKEDQILVCAIRRPDGQYLIHRRPNKGLLAGLWELPSQGMPQADWPKIKVRKAKALEYVSSLLGAGGRDLKHLGEIGCVPWLFSHLKLTMHVHVFELEETKGEEAATPASKTGKPPSKWLSPEALDEESMGTGMRKCWALVKEMGQDS
ncbi:DNA glycosylase, partial [Thozetella sp. PMI_491]